MKVVPPRDSGNCNRKYEFGCFLLDANTRLLSREGKGVHLTPKVLDVLFALVEARGRLVEKDQLMKAVWPDSFVEEGNLTQSVSILRKSLGEKPEGSTYIETIPTRGYRLSVDVRELGADSALSVEPSPEAGCGFSDSSGQRGLVVSRWKTRSGVLTAALLIALVAT